jgi:hypothetical protein
MVAKVKSKTPVVDQRAAAESTLSGRYEAHVADVRAAAQLVADASGANVTAVLRSLAGSRPGVKVTQAFEAELAAVRTSRQQALEDARAVPESTPEDRPVFTKAAEEANAATDAEMQRRHREQFTRTVQLANGREVLVAYSEFEITDAESGLPGTMCAIRVRTTDGAGKPVALFNPNQDSLLKAARSQFVNASVLAAVEDLLQVNGHEDVDY